MTSPTSPEQLQTLLDIASEAALDGGAVLSSYWGNVAGQVEEKGRSGDLVTIADRSAEAAVIQVLGRHCPDIGIMAEESGLLGNQEGDWVWVIDPLDGTTNFAHQYPFSAVSIGLLYQDEPVVGVVYDPFHKDLFRAARGLGATRNRQPIQVSKAPKLSQSLLVTGFAYDRRETTDNNYAEFCYLTHLTQGVRRGGSASVDLAYVACGRLDGYWERGLSAWDVAAGIVLVQEAGGMVTAYDGGPVDVSSGRLVATNGHLHEALVDTLATVPPLATWSKDPSTWPALDA
ncbi:MAG: inositol monophosphatase family protein [Cyanobacteria bacterium P01_H01_bin.130]